MLVRILDRAPSLALPHVALRAAVVGLGLAACWAMVVWAGGELFVLVHAFYLPVTLAAFWLGRTGAIAAGVAAGLLAGPLLPSEVRPDLYATSAWVLRLGFFVGFSVLAGMLLDRIRTKARSMTKLYARTLRGFVRALAFKDAETGDHCERVARNAVRLGRRLGLSNVRLEAVYWAGYLHDLGKIETPGTILGKPAALTRGEYEVVQRHASTGADLLEGVSESFRPIAQGVRHHHERWDGTGYPAGLTGEEIPLFGRILGVVDVFEALTSDRPYRDAWPVADAAEYMQDRAGTHFDPSLVDAFLTLVAEEGVHVQGRRARPFTTEAPEVFNPDVLREPSRDPGRVPS